MREPIILALLMLTGCGTMAPLANLSPAAVPDEINKCMQLQLSKWPARDLTEGEVEKLSSWDRYVAIARGKCLKQLAMRDNTLAGK